MHKSPYKGYFVENFVLCELESYGWDSIANWRGRTSEVEFIVETNDAKVIPVEVKAGKNRKAKSLAAYITKYSPEIAVKFTGDKYGKNKNMITYPLYMVSIFNDDYKVFWKR